MQSSVRYLAWISDDPARLADFYTTQFGLRELGRSATGDVSVTDGFYNLSFLKRRDGVDQPGLHHFGVAVDSANEFRERVARHAPGTVVQPDAGDLHHGDFLVKDPNGFPISISTGNFGVPTAEGGLPAIHHAAVVEPNGDTVAQFFVDVLGLEAVAPDTWGWIARFVSDGVTQFTVLADADAVRAHNAEVTLDHIKSGLNHFGIEAPNVPEIVARLPKEANPSLRVDRPIHDDYYRVWDPDGNHFDLRAAHAWREERGLK